MYARYPLIIYHNYINWNIALQPLFISLLSHFVTVRKNFFEKFSFWVLTYGLTHGNMVSTDEAHLTLKGEKEMNKTRIRYDELKVGDVVMFHGAEVRIVNYSELPAPANEWYPNEKTITFTIEPFNEEAEQMLGKFYSHGTYGGVGCLSITLLNR